MKDYLYKSTYRDLIYGVDAKVPLYNGNLVTAINFDNAATTPPFISVMDEIVKFAPWYSSIHRGTGYKSRYSSSVYDESRKIVAEFVGADLKRDVVIYVKNTTEAINKLSNRLSQINGECVILSTDMEHHSNDLPWRKNYFVDYIEIDSCGMLRLDDLEAKLIKYEGKVKLVTITGASNVTGYINPIYHAAKLAHKYNAEILVDGAQLVPHMKIEMKPYNFPEHIDYIVFSAHKMYAPFGIGVLIGPMETFKMGDCDSPGGGTIKHVTHDMVIWDNPPEKDEAGTPNLMGVVALTAAIKALKNIGMINIHKQEKKLMEYTIDALKDIPDAELYCNYNDISWMVGIIPFNIKGVHHSIVAEALSKEAGIAVRSGCFCAHPYIQKLLKLSSEEIQTYINNSNAPRPGMVRLSFGIYNDRMEIDILMEMLWRISQNKDYYIRKYSV